MIHELLDKITVNAQSSICIDSDPKIYFDPFRIDSESHDADLIFFTHPHYDHFSPDDFRKVLRDDTIFIAPEIMKDDLKKAGISSDFSLFMRPGDRISEKNISIEAVPAYNINKPMHRKKSGWLGYVITLNEIKIYDAGDCDAIPEGKAVKTDIAFVPAGGTFTMNAKEAAAFVNAMKPAVAIPIHYGTIVGSPSDFDKFASMVQKDIKVVKKLEF